MAVSITLASNEIFLCATAGIMRQVENIKRERESAHGHDSTTDWQIHIEGVMGEYVIAKYLNMHWSGKGTFRGGDVGNLQVRTAAGQRHRLILHEEDADDDVFWLVCGQNGVYEIKGWLHARDGKKSQYWADPTGNNRHAFFVPQSVLMSPESHNKIVTSHQQQYAQENFF